MEYISFNSQKNCKLLYSNGFIYRTDRTSYRCTASKCNGRGRVEGNFFISSAIHSHSPDFEEAQSKLCSNEFIEFLLKYNINKERIRQLYNELSLNSYFEMNLSAISQRIYRKSKIECSKSKVQTKPTLSRCSIDAFKVKMHEICNRITSDKQAYLAEYCIRNVEESSNLSVNGISSNLSISSISQDYEIISNENNIAMTDSYFDNENLFNLPIELDDMNIDLTTIDFSIFDETKSGDDNNNFDNFDLNELINGY